ncbi:MAG: HAMP domain-containing sensor histidine kinase [Bacteroidota bacterium]|nr:HAMP domain-containing sensor histidine kinase [Bacteroidota bacterium]
MKNYIFITLSVLIFFIGVLIEKSPFVRGYFYEKCNDVLYEKLGQFKVEQLAFLESEDLIKTVKDFDISTDLYQDLKKRNINIYAYQNKCLAFWSDNRLVFQNFEIDTQLKVQYVHNQNGWFQVIATKKENFDIYCVYNFYKEYPKKNNYFINQFDERMGFSNFKLRPFLNQENHTGVSNKIFNEPPKLEIETFVNYNIFKWVIFFYLLSFVLFLIYAWLQSIKNQSFNVEKFVVHMLLYVIGLAMFLFFNWWKKNINSIPILSPDLAAYSNIFPSFAHGFNAVVFFFCLVSLLFILLKKTIINNGFLKILLTLSRWLLMGFIVLYVIPVIIRNSGINYDFKEPSSLNFYSFLGIFKIYIIGITWLLWSRLTISISNENFNFKKFLTLEVLVGFIVLVMFYFIQNENFFLLISIIFLTTVINYIILKVPKLNINYLLLIFVLISMVFSVQFEQINSNKEKEYRKVFASKIISKQDFELDVSLSNIESELIATKAFENFFYQDESENKDIEIIYKYTYFNDLIKDYDVDLLKFDSEGMDNEENNYSFLYLNDLYNGANHQAYTSYLAYIKDVHYLGGYISKYEICPEDTTLGYVFLLITPKIKSDAYNFENFFGNSKNDKLYQNQYSFAIYKNNQLIKGSGDFSYKLVKDYNYDFKGDESFLNYKNYSHYYKQIDHDTFVLVSNKSYSNNRMFTMFTFIFLFFSLMLIVFYGFLYLFTIIFSLFSNFAWCQKMYVSLTKYFHLINVKKLYLGTKIRIYFMMMAIGICSFVVFVVVKNVNINFKERQNEILDKKVNQIYNEIEVVFQSDEKRNLRTLINELANRFEVDINLFNNDGTLYQTANNRMFFEGWFSSYINPEAYHRFTVEKQYQFKNTERIGSLKYVSSYISILDKDFKIVSYLNVPYFSREIDLKNQFSNFISNLINVLTLLLILSLILANQIGSGLVKPLKMITESLAKIKLGSENKYILLRRNDEVGQLVEEYNKMIDQLDASTQKLALSEREGAWKEMAKQVAHEIKNPLTPMRLHLQHLQMSIQRNDDNVNEKVAAISQLLIDQIDQLSKMAEEFSSFASMPIAVKEKIDIGKLLQNTIDLFSVHSDFNIDFLENNDAIFAIADAQQLQRVFTNIIKNAYQASGDDENGSLQILIQTLDNQCIIVFKDNGIGISDDFKNKVFAPNFSTKNSGMGLGLSISKKIIESFDGEIWFESVLGEGSTFYVKLPIV